MSKSHLTVTVYKRRRDFSQHKHTPAGGEEAQLSSLINSRAYLPLKGHILSDCSSRLMLKCKLTCQNYFFVAIMSALSLTTQCSDITCCDILQYSMITTQYSDPFRWGCCSSSEEDRLKRPSLPPTATQEYTQLWRTHSSGFLRQHHTASHLNIKPKILHKKNLTINTA